MYNYFTLFFILLNVNVLVHSETHSLEYCWKDFNGEIPQDAFVAGTDSKGQIYIGQVLYDGKLIPGKLYRNDKRIYFEYDERARKETENIKILCATHVDSLEWFLTKTADFKRIKFLNLVKGGYQYGFKTYIGLVKENGETNVGKVICRESACLGLYAEKNGKNVEYHSYYILAYNGDSNNVV